MTIELTDLDLLPPSLASAALTLVAVPGPSGPVRYKARLNFGSIGDGSPSNLLPISTIYTASGAIAPGDSLSIVNSASNVTMTLAAPTTNGQRLAIKRYGVGTVTILLTLDGAAAQILANGSAPGKELIHLIGVVGDATLGTTWLAPTFAAVSGS